MSNFQDVSKAILVMSELFGRRISPEAADMLMEDLAEYNPDYILAALQACRKELKFFPTTAEIITRVQAMDGRPGAEEAWAMIPKDDVGSVIWTEEMSGAYGVAHDILREGDTVAARMAFRETYFKLVTEARNSKRVTRWTPSLGTSESGRNAALIEAFGKGRIGYRTIQQIAPHLLNDKETKELPVDPNGQLKIAEIIRGVTDQTSLDTKALPAPLGERP